MKFGRRLLLFAAGLMIGCGVVYMLFPNHDWLGWTPGKQMLKQIQSSRIHTTPHGKCRMDCLGISMENFERAKWEGEIDFSKSDAQGNPKRYLLEYDELKFILLTTDSTTTIAEVSRVGSDKKCDCN
ncbi:MAG: hypothetical protein ACK5EW_05645 [Bacteroidota bacterium]|jgi:hypothetical protein